LGFAVLAAGLALGPLPALAQETVPPATTNLPTTDAVGPRELQNFKLPGTVTRPAEPQPAQRATTPPRASRTVERAAPAPSGQQSSTATRTAERAGQPESSTTAPTARSRPAERPVERLRQTPPASSVTVALPQLNNGSVRSSAAAPAPAPAADYSQGAESGTLAPEHKFSILPWLLAALVLAAGIGFLLWRNRSREAFAGAPRLDAYLAPEPAAAPTPSPVPPKAPAPSIPGIVSTRLRPWIDIGFRPIRCIVEDERVTIQFDLELFNSGSAPARAVLIEASLFNAGPSQDRDIGQFFESPVGEGERIVAIQPLKRMNIRTQVVAERSQVQVYEVAGRQVFVPLIAFNALYRWSSGGDGQTSVSYLLGRDTKGEKMAPFRLDLGPRVFRGVGAHPLPVGVRS